MKIQKNKKILKKKKINNFKYNNKKFKEKFNLIREINQINIFLFVK